jgi:hypothetical protein
MRAARLLALPALLAPALARAGDDDRAAPAYGIAAAELVGVGVVAIHLGTSLSPGEGAGLALNFAPIVLGIGAAVAGEVYDLDPVPPLAMHGGALGGLSLFMLGAVFDGISERDHLSIGYGALILGAVGAVGGGYVAATMIDDGAEAIGFLVAPFGAAFVGAVTSAIVHAIDDQADIGEARIVGFTGAGALLGLAGAVLYALPDRSPKLAPAIHGDGEATVVSFGGAF